MKARCIKQRAVQATLCVAAAALATGIPSASYGGEPIQFSSGRTAPTSHRQSKLTKELEKASPGRAPNPGVEFVTPNVSARAVDPKEEKKQKQAAFERKNWMFFDDSARLDDRAADDEAFGIRSEEDFEQDGEENSWLSPRRDERNRPRSLESPHTRVSSGSTRTGAGPSRSEQNQSPQTRDAEGEKSKSLAGAATGPGARLGPDLKSSSILSLSPGASGDRSDGKGFSFKGLFGGDGSRSTRGPLAGPGAGLSQNSGYGFESTLAPRPSLSGLPSAPASPGFSPRSAHSLGAPSVDRSTWGDLSLSGRGLGSLDSSAGLLPRADSLSPLPAVQQQNEQRRSFREFDKPKFPGQ